jgi:YidC/Oxa1 family membrane protein insertase
MQSMDRNTVIGFVLLAILLFAYLFISTKNSQELQVRKKSYEDSLARVEALKKTPAAVKVDTVAQAPANLRDTTAVGQALHGSEQLLTVENDLLKIEFSNKGGQPKTVELKKYNTWEKKPVKLIDNNSAKLSYAINLPNQSAQVSDLFFQAGTVTKSGDSTQVVSFTLPTNNGEYITHTFTIHTGSYLVDFDIKLNGTNKLLTQNSLNLLWNVEVMKKEKDAKYERTQSEICFVEDGSYDYENILSETDKKFEKPIHWVTVKQQFFNTTLIAKNKLESGEIKWTHPTEDSVPLIVNTNATFNTKVSGTDATVPLQFYYGPNDFKTLHAVGVERMDKIVNLGQGFYAFVRPINQYIVIPVFDFFKKFIGSFGVVIALLTLFIRLLTSPLVYTSYLSGAKMKALRPEIDMIKKKYPDDQQQFGMEQMKLFREAGVNPLGGCIPALLQIPIFFALYSFFNGKPGLKGRKFSLGKRLIGL